MAKKKPVSKPQVIKEKKPKVVKPSMLRDFTKQYRHKFIAGHLFIECPMVCTSFILACDWMPKADYVDDMYKELHKVGRSITMGCVYSRNDVCYYIVSHLWLPNMLTWCKEDMKMYIEKIFTTMLKNAYIELVEPVTVVVPETYVEKQKDVKEDKVVIEKKYALLEKIHNQVEEEEFYKKYGLSIKTYKAMCSDAKTLVEQFDEETHVLDFHKLLFNKYKILLRDTMKVLVDNGIIVQDTKDPNYKNNYFLAPEFVAYGFGVNIHDADKNTTYPSFYKRGLFTILLLLHDAGVLSKQVIPNLF